MSKMPSWDEFSLLFDRNNIEGRRQFIVGYQDLIDIDKEEMEELLEEKFEVIFANVFGIAIDWKAASDEMIASFGQRLENDKLSGYINEEDNMLILHYNGDESHFDSPQVVDTNIDDEEISLSFSFPEDQLDIAEQLDPDHTEIVMNEAGQLVARSGEIEVPIEINEPQDRKYLALSALYHVLKEKYDIKLFEYSIFSDTNVFLLLPRNYCQKAEELYGAQAILAMFHPFFDD